MRLNITLVLIFLVSTLKPAFAQQDTLFRSFTISQADNGVLINFTILGGITCSGVRIERSTDNVNFYGIYEFVGVCGSSTSDESYSYTDINPVNNITSLYRLDLGSLGLYSKTLDIKFIKYGDEGTILFPNPCGTFCKLYYSNPQKEEHILRLFDVSGKMVFQIANSDQVFFINPDGLETGIYYFELLRNKEITSRGKISII